MTSSIQKGSKKKRRFGSNPSPPANTVKPAPPSNPPSQKGESMTDGLAAYYHNRDREVFGEWIPCEPPKHGGYNPLTGTVYAHRDWHWYAFKLPPLPEKTS